METPKLRVFRQITLVDLATHTSGLPRMPGNFRPRNSENPYADYTEEQLYAFLRSYELIRDIGSKFEYSNLGFGLLGQALKRFKEQKALPGSESATRRLIGELRDKHVDYDQFTPQFASTARQAETPFAALVAALGPLQSLTLKGVSPGGMDIYELKFDQGTANWQINLSEDGKVAGLWFRKAP